MHFLSNASTEAFEGAREKVKNFLNANRVEEIVFTMGATDAINLVAYSYAEPNLIKDDEIILSTLEHHSNIVPWNFLRERKGINIKWVDSDNNGNISVESIRNLVTKKTKIIAITQMSNVLGSIIPLKEIIQFAHSKEILVLVDGCQGIAHQETDIRDLDCDFYVFSGHKLYGPTGVGVLYAKYELLDKMRPWRGGGEMIKEVSKDSISYGNPPYKFEAGTPNFVQVVGLGKAIDYFTERNKEDIFQHEHSISEYAYESLSNMKALKLYGDKNISSPIISFSVEGSHPHDIATIIDNYGVAIRAGHHCAQPLMNFLGVTSTARASIGMYTSKEDIDNLIISLEKAIKIFN
ncbi:uncharacterized protein METZ01_LOCUS83026 [marine metagenome]|uniref:cysteine desulfurase n=1 Tax=marine metagenome TaxID=408172 RepID=A0A381UPT4_9ZZZZ